MSLYVEHYAWVDERLAELYYGYALTADNCDEYQDAGLLKEKWAWVDRRLEAMIKNKKKKRLPRLGKHKRSIMDIYNYFQKDSLDPHFDEAISVSTVKSIETNPFNPFDDSDISDLSNYCSENDE
jgi:hypothetical protein